MMKKHGEYVKHAGLDIVISFVFFYMLPALQKSNGIIEQFNYSKGFFMVMVAALFFAAADVMIRIWYRRTLKKIEKEKNSMQAIVKIKTIYGTLFVMWLILIAFIFVMIEKSLGVENLPGNMTLLLISFCLLLIAVPIIGAFNYYREKHPQGDY